MNPHLTPRLDEWSWATAGPSDVVTDVNSVEHRIVRLSEMRSWATFLKVVFAFY